VLYIWSYSNRRISIGSSRRSEIVSCRRSYHDRCGYVVAISYQQQSHEGTPGTVNYDDRDSTNTD